MTASPLFIVLEGIDGSGTTTQAERLLAHLRGRGRQVSGTREPSTGPVGKLIREILLGGHAPAPGSSVHGDTMALLFAADRRDHLQREIEPALAAGTDVVSDRYVWSSLAYQAQEADLPWVRGLARSLREPDLTLLIDLPIEEAARRRALAGRPVERYDADSYLAKVAAHYRKLAAEDPQAVVIDGRPNLDDVTQLICNAVDNLLAARGER
ncbi:MAG: dTMP kinase [Deltaproteobacteria bacterium]|nr:dTMP kinase [Deltaproteobacteria bacterium]